MMQDGLGSVRSVVNNSSGVEWSGSPDPFGNYFGEAGTRQTPYGFTGEYTDPITGTVHLRARDYHPAPGVFPALDPFEGVRDEPMSINGYSYVHGDPVNFTDPSGMQACTHSFACPVPEVDEFYTLGCGLFPDTFECSRSKSTDRFDFTGNWLDEGDVSIQAAHRLCLLLNNGLCSNDVSIIGDIIRSNNTPQRKQKSRGAHVVGVTNGECNSCPPPTVTCRIDLLVPSGLGTSRGGHGCPPTTVAHFHIDTLSWSGPWIDPNTHECYCEPIRVPQIHCLQNLNEAIFYYTLCPNGYTFNRG